MLPWMIVAGVLLLVLLLWRPTNRTEHFLTLDPATQKAQRQALQFEGEHRYNDFARLQSTHTLLPSDQIDAAVQQVVPRATSGTSSLLTLLSMKNLGARDDGSGKTGAGVEQTGMVQAKVDFCESISAVDCARLSSDQMAECGFCHRDGIDSRGKGHRGGMFISSDDQIRENQRASAMGVKPVYAPTIGSCSAGDFTLMPEPCNHREKWLMCQRAGGVSTANPCGQCYGAARPGSTGLLLMGINPTDPTQPIQKPLIYNGYLHVSHPGGHGGLTVVSNGQTVASLGPSTAPVAAYTSLSLTGIQEGQQVQINLYGAPKVWAAWLSNRATFDPADGTARNVSLDIGLTSMSPVGAYEIAGDKNSRFVTDALGGPGASPNTVLWFLRRDEVLNPIITNAWYGLTPNPADGQGVDITPFVRQLAGQGSNIAVIPQSLNVADPYPGTVKRLYITQDNGNLQSAADGQTFDQSRTTSNVSFNVTIPATLIDPQFEDDRADCPSGPIVTTEVGAGLMGAHSCFKPDGSFNATQYCMQELFQSSGGLQAGSGWPGSDAAVAAIVSTVAGGGSSSDVTLDQVVAWLNTMGSIASYGVDLNGAPVPFDVYKSACLFMLGFTPVNPCAGTPAAGPHSAECLDYLFRTSGNPSLDGGPVEPTSLGYPYCTANGTIAPLNPDGSINHANVSLANQQGAIANVRGFYQGQYNASQDSSDFNAQAAAMRNCMGVNLQPPVIPPSACPPPASDQWRCLPPSKLQTDTNSDTAVPAIRSTNPRLGDGGWSMQCLSMDGNSCHMFASNDDCENNLNTQINNNPTWKAIQPPNNQWASLDAYIRNTV